MILTPDITRFSGDTFVIRIQIVDPDSISGFQDASDVTEIKFLTSGAAAISKTLGNGITQFGADDQGTWDIQIDGTDTDAISGYLNFEVELTVVAGYKRTVKQGVILINGDMIP